MVVGIPGSPSSLLFPINPCSSLSFLINPYKIPMVGGIHMCTFFGANRTIFVRFFQQRRRFGVSPGWCAAIPMSSQFWRCSSYKARVILRESERIPANIQSNYGCCSSMFVQGWTEACGAIKTKQLVEKVEVCHSWLLIPQL